MKRKWSIGAFLAVSLLFSMAAFGQDYAPPPAPAGQVFSEQQLEQMLGPIALYPDPLIAQVLPACTQPAQIAIAYSYVSSGADPNAIDQQNWDPGVKAVAHYPDVLKMLNDNMPWTTELGQAYMNQETDVMNAVQALRAQAQQLGNLQNIPQDNVVDDGGDIEIMPADPDMLYVPTYDPSLVFYTPCYGQPFLTFGIGFPLGGWLVHDFDWHNHRLITWGPGHPRPDGWWRGTPAFRRDAIARAPVWRAPAHVVARPGGFGRVDRGFAPAPREVRPVGRPAEVRPVERPVEVRPVERPEVARPVERSSAFGGESAGDARASSFRGQESRGGGAPAPARGGGGGGGGGAGRGRR
jgi:Protein of unknown function (DUF3300)